MKDKKEVSLKELVDVMVGFFEGILCECLIGLEKLGHLESVDVECQCDTCVEERVNN